MRKVLKGIIEMNVFLVPLLLIACVSGGGKIVGEIFDRESGEKVANAMVIVRWMGELLSPFDSRTVCVHTDVATTDDHGVYKMEKWSKDLPFGPVVNLAPFFIVYKEGYVLSSSWEGIVIRVNPRSTEDPVTLSELKDVVKTLTCSQGGKSRRNQYPVLRSIYYAAQEIAISEQEMAVVDWIREVAADAAVSEEYDRELTATEAEKRREKFLQDNLK